MNIGSKFETVDDESSRLSLIKYESPVEITQKLEAYEKAKLIEKPNESKPSSEDILNIILPPREWRNSQNEYFMQYVSHEKPERADVQLVQKALEASLLKMQARTDAVCPIRQLLFSQVFDEIIRQVALNCPERGLMLLRLRDERKMTIAAYETIYQQSKAYGMRKQFESEEGMEELYAEVRAGEERRGELERRRLTLLSKVVSMEEKYRERRVVQGEKRQYELKALTRQNDFLQKFLSTKKVVEEAPTENKDEEEAY